jgi:translation initiation factor eIF-2B subunit delta
MMEDLDRSLRALAKDRASGAVALAVDAVDLADRWRQAGRSPSKLAAALAAMHPAVATVQNLARRIAEHPDDDLADLRRSLIEGNRLIAARLRAIIPQGRRIITISNSSTIAAALPLLDPSSVIVLESRPGGEGSELAETLKRSLGPARVTLEPDAAMGKLVEGVDVALVGVDSFDAEGNLVHKVGTLPLALCCRHAAVPFYAAGHSFKKFPKPIRGQPSDPWFDHTPSALITAVVTELARAD